MVQNLEKLNVVSIEAQIRSEFKSEFVEWQTELNTLIAAYPGFVSLEIISLHNDEKWTIVQRFKNSASAQSWLESDKRAGLISKLENIAYPNSIHEIKIGESSLKGGFTEVFITEVNPDRDEEYRAWIAKIHKAEAKAPGFRGVYVQPSSNGARTWITFLQFDNEINLDHWLTSSERLEILNESKVMIKSLESQRVVSSFSGWFSSIAKIDNIPSVWKQTMIVLLVLYPLVMLELKYLNPLFEGLNSALATFIGNTISVTLISWPMMPIVIWFLGWWLSPKEENRLLITILGTILVSTLYLIEILIFWKFL